MATVHPPVPELRATATAPPAMKLILLRLSFLREALASATTECWNAPMPAHPGSCLMLTVILVYATAWENQLAPQMNAEPQLPLPQSLLLHHHQHAPQLVDRHRVVLVSFHLPLLIPPMPLVLLGFMEASQKAPLGA